VAVARGHDEVHPVDVAVERHVDVTLDAAGETRHRRVEAQAGDPADGLALARAGAGAARLDDRDVGPVEPAGDGRLLLGAERDARRLLSVTKRRVQKLYLEIAVRTCVKFGKGPE